MSLFAKTNVSLDIARAIADACEAKAREEGWRMTIAIAEHGGTLKFLSRMDGAMPISMALAPLKAHTSANLPLSTRKVRDVAGSVKGLELVQGVTTVAGGLPIIAKNGEWVGGVGVSGDSEDNDEICAQAGLDAVRHLL
jgi:uncharacterized protein GlcG (DUF336 family)